MQYNTTVNLYSADQGTASFQSDYNKPRKTIKT